MSVSASRSPRPVSPRPFCRALAPDLPEGAAVVHFSGATSVHALDAARGPTACMHPLQTVWPELGPDQLEGAYAAVTGDQAVGGRLDQQLGMTPFPLDDAAKPVYHAASAFASNYLVTLTHAALELLERAGMQREAALAALRPLQHRTVDVAGRRLTAPHILIAVGGRPMLPDIPGADLGITSDEFFELEKRPDRVAVVGSGYIAIELTSIFAALGSKATLVLPSPRESVART